MPTLAQDVQFSIRRLRQSPGLAFAAIATLALGIGANTAMFTVIDSVLIRPLPYPDANRLISIRESTRANGDVHSTAWLTLQDLRRQSRSFTDIAGYIGDVAILQTPVGGKTVFGARLTSNLLPLLRTQPLLGRAFNEADAAPGAPPTFLLSERLWRETFHADRQIFGREIRIGDVPHTVIGVMPAGFAFPDEDRSDAEKGIWLPWQPTEAMRQRGFTVCLLIGRLRPSITEQQARAEIATISANMRRQDPASATGYFALRPYRETVAGSIGPVFLALNAALGLVLLIACANVANLQLSRCLARDHELALRTALGAPKWRLVRELLVESAVLSLIGALVGLAIAFGILQAVHGLPADMIPRASEIHLRFTVLFALTGLAALVTVLSSLTPVLFAIGAEPHGVLRGTGRGISARAARSRMASFIVAGEVALAAVLLIACSLLFRTLYNLEHKWLGFQVENLVTFSATPPTSAGYLSGAMQPKPGEQSVATYVYRPILDELRKLPGVEQAALSSSIPFDGVDMNTSFSLNGHENKTPQEKNTNDARIRVMSGGYMEVVHTPIIRGRALSDEDTENQPFVAVVNQAFAHRFLKGDPIGQQLGLGGKETGMVKPYTVIGVAANSTQESTAAPAAPELMLSYRQIPEHSLFYPILVTSATKYLLRTRAQNDLASAIHSVFKRFAPGFAIDNLQAMQKTVDAANFNHRLAFYLIGSFAGVAVLMVMVGLYGILAQFVNQRKQEIGVRLALGASSQSILALILRQGSLLIGAGLVIGLACSLAASKLIASFLYGVQPMDVGSYTGSALALFGVGLVAALLPARRASAIEPMEALRTE
jgi:putative ABC transport system permease protein